MKIARHICKLVIKGLAASHLRQEQADPGRAVRVGLQFPVQQPLPPVLAGARGLFFGWARGCVPGPGGVSWGHPQGGVEIPTGGIPGDRGARERPPRRGEGTADLVRGQGRRLQSGWKRMRRPPRPGFPGARPSGAPAPAVVAFSCALILVTPRDSGRKP